MNQNAGEHYRRAGVDVDKGNTFVDRIKPLVKSTHQRGVLSDLRGFAGLFALDGNRFEQPVLVSATDGVGTKLKVAVMSGINDTIGIDLVAMCVNDIIVCGAQPLFFLDYLATSHLEIDTAAAIVEGIVSGCQQAKCSLIGGETAELPGMYHAGEYDVAGFAVGIVERNEIIDGSDISVGNVLIGLGSNGLHANGFSLVRKICFEDNNFTLRSSLEDLDDPLGKVLLTPTRIYVQPVLNIIKRFSINGMVHITGGGFFDNIPRVLPDGCRVTIDRRTWPTPPIFTFLARTGALPDDEMFRVFNMGIGFILIVAAADADDICHQLRAVGESPYIIGSVQPRDENLPIVEIKG
jgi:phosphoribosylformylglycinamidine cyclo-ligase